MAPDSAPSPTLSPSRGLRRGIGVAATLVIWLSLITFPMRPGKELDPSWQELLVFAHAKGWQFGHEVIFTAGPWGFLNSLFHLGELGSQIRLYWEVVGRLILAAGIVSLAQRLSIWRQVLFLLTFAVFGWVFSDFVYLSVISLCVVNEWMRPDTPRWRWVLWAICMPFLALFKFSFLVVASAGAGLAWALFVTRRRWVDAVIFPLIVGASFLFFWRASGQSFDSLIGYFRYSLEISSGYGAAMGIDERIGVFISGLLMLANAFWLLRGAWRPAHEQLWMRAAVVFLAIAWFVVWKHGFTRADGHVFGFCFYSLALFAALPGYFTAKRGVTWTDLGLFACLAGVMLIEPTLLRGALPGTVARVTQNARALTRLSSMSTAWRNELSQARDAAQNTRLQRTIRQSTVDVLNCELGFALLNGFNLDSRPIFQSYSSYTERLQSRNLRFYRSSRAPDFVLWNFTSIDGRYPPQDDALLVAEFRRGYDPLYQEGDFLLLKKQNPLPSASLVRQGIESHTLAWGETYELPLIREHPVWIQIFAHPSFIGRLRTLLYKPAQASLVITDENGQETTWRLVTEAAKSGFIIQPYLEARSDFEAFMNGKGTKWVRSIRLSSPEGQAEFWHNADVIISTLPELPLTSESTFRHLISKGIISHAPAKVSTPVTPEIFNVDGHNALLVHPPSSLEFPVPPGATAITSSFGIREGAYTGEGKTDGVEFVLTGEWPNGRSVELWRRYLDPLNHPEDRGMQTFSVPLGKSAPPTVKLTTGPGPKADFSWDWAYISEFRFVVP